MLRTATVCVWLAAASAATAPEGFDAASKGGRGGDVYRVTNLNDSGEGSLREAIRSARGPRTVVFALSGTIYLKSPLVIDKPFLTLAGQTAPGDGITVAGYSTSVLNTHDVIVRYLRFRPGDIECPRYQGDALSVDRSTDVLLDHVSASWSVDETLSITNSDRVTVQWSFITESLNASCHQKGEHGYGSLLRYGAGRVTMHHNLYAHHRSRNPRLGDNIRLDFFNNVIYNASGDVGYSGGAAEGTPRLNYIANYVVAGPSTPEPRRTRAFRGGSDNTVIWQEGNRIDSNRNGVRDGIDTGWDMFQGTFTRAEARFSGAAVALDSAERAYARVLASAGASKARDAVDRRIVRDVSIEAGKSIASQADVGGWPDLGSEAAPPDVDGDGLPDAWEKANRLNPRDAADGPAHLEAYLDELAGSRAVP
jgi:pectate lyase